ncbi:CDP-diacylglycerol--serine O-phosphatidyltransferase [Cyclonatronum proteinivorum]|uniref:CDP-diacylglycerol--serine O-phosphatidyltransferase n=1 Tax=Cyclonatronum proteinivorum TaxID=1457365 RepID=A0A345UKQ1_9BACT|nr:CDP-diacylglycerol--serine O-phosphatidyltransferase [Cyclonatronum proteinivorum]
MRFQERIKKPIPRSVVPSFFTLMNLFSGFLAILMVFEGKLATAAWLIVLAAFFDVLDGFMARLTNGDSVFGIELDSLSDIVSFGAAPGILVYAWLFSAPTPGPANIALPLVAALPALCGAIRLARFNIDAKAEPSSFFKGLPIPAQAMMLVAFFLTFQNNLEFFEIFKHGANSVIIPTIIILSLLMVSTVPFDKVPRFNKEYMRQNRPLVFLFIVYALTIIILQEYGLMIVFTIFILRGLIMFGIQFWDDVMGDESETESDPQQSAG